MRLAPSQKSGLAVRALGALALAATLATTGPAAAEDRSPVLVTIDQAVILRFPEPARSVIIGNPSIADATILDTQMVVLTGRSFGTTNLIVLGADGTPIVDELVTVRSSDLQVTVFRRSTRETYSCNPTCEPTLNVGDAPSIFDLTAQQLQTRGNLALGN
ncbi:MAG: pilus assembly protein N-terminal domain-containing protein [Bauldia sp.]